MRDPNRQAAIARAGGADVIRCVTKRSILATIRRREEEERELLRHFTKNRDKRRTR